MDLFGVLKDKPVVEEWLLDKDLCDAMPIMISGIQVGIGINRKCLVNVP